MLCRAVGEEEDSGADEEEDSAERRAGSFERDVQLWGNKSLSKLLRFIYLGAVATGVLQVLIFIFSGNSNQPQTRPFNTTETPFNSTETIESSYNWRQAATVFGLSHLFRKAYNERFRLANIIQTVIEWANAARQWVSRRGVARQRQYGSTEAPSETHRAAKKRPPFGFQQLSDVGSHCVSISTLRLSH